MKGMITSRGDLLRRTLGKDLYLNSGGIGVSKLRTLGGYLVMSDNYLRLVDIV